MRVLFLTYSNSQTSPLPSLREEDDTIFKVLSSRALQQHYFLHRDSYTSTQKIAEYLSIYREKIFLFLYSGHAGRDYLFLDQEEARAEGIAHLLGQCVKFNNLKLVFLNGCSTQGQVKQLLHLGIPIVIASSAPVGDNDAKDFSIRFFQALNEQATIGEAFELAIGQILTKKALTVHRDLGSQKDLPDNTPLWGLFHSEENASVLNEKLPTKAYIQASEDYKPNLCLIEGLMDALEEYNEEIKSFRYQEQANKKVSLPKKRMVILNTLPAPIAEHLRKLMVPVDEENEGFDKISEARLLQLVSVYQITMKFITFILLAQLWEAKYSNKNFLLPQKLRTDILHFLDLPEEEQSIFDFIPFLRSIRQMLPTDQVRYFAPELESIEELVTQDEQFQSACFFFQVVQQKLKQHSVAQYEISDLCIRGEECLAEYFRRLGFLAKYTLAAVNSIDVEKYRHLIKPTFRHSIVKLLDLLGGLAEEEVVLEEFMYNRSVLLLKHEDNQITGYLNLSPFIIDENAFEKNTDVSKIRFFYRYEAITDTYCFQYVNKPTDALLKISNGKYSIVKTQFDAFKKLLLDEKSF